MYARMYDVAHSDNTVTTNLTDSWYLIGRPSLLYII